MGVVFIIVILAQKSNIAKFLLHIFGGLYGLWLTASKRTFLTINENFLDGLFGGFVWFLACYSKTAYTATYLVSGTKVAVFG